MDLMKDKSYAVYMIIVVLGILVVIVITAITLLYELGTTRMHL